MWRRRKKCTSVNNKKNSENPTYAKLGVGSGSESGRIKMESRVWIVSSIWRRSTALTVDQSDNRILPNTGTDPFLFKWSNKIWIQLGQWNRIQIRILEMNGIKITGESFMGVLIYKIFITFSNPNILNKAQHSRSMKINKAQHSRSMKIKSAGN